MDKSGGKSRDLYKSDSERHLFAVDERSGRAKEENGSLMERLTDLLQHIPELYHETITLRVREGLSYDQIAERLSVPLGTVKSRLYRARQNLGRALKELEDRREAKRDSAKDDS